MTFTWQDVIRGWEQRAPRGTFYRKQEPREGVIDARDSIRAVPIITSLGGSEDRHEQALMAELEAQRD